MSDFQQIHLSHKKNGKFFHVHEQIKIKKLSNKNQKIVE